MNAIIIPAYNEGNTIATIIAAAKNHCSTIIVVNDGSADNTKETAVAAGATVLSHKVNLGKGAALKTGCDFALSHGISKIIVLDADGQHDPNEIPQFITALENHDIAFGYRKIPKTMPFMMRFGNAAINVMLQSLYRVHIEDSQCGYRAFTAAAYQKIRWDALDYYVETEMILNAGRKKLKHTGIPIKTIYADNYKGTTVLDGVKIITKMIGRRLW